MCNYYEKYNILNMLNIKKKGKGDWIYILSGKA